MNKNKQRIAIAQACGWTLIRDDGMGHDPLKQGLGRWHLPDYLNDLNAIYEAEKRLNNNSGLSAKTIYIEWLEEICNVNESGMAYFATASQRAEAFLKTMLLWEE